MAKNSQHGEGAGSSSASSVQSPDSSSSHASSPQMPSSPQTATLSVPYSGRNGKSRSTSYGRYVTVVKFNPRQVSNLSANNSAESHVSVNMHPKVGRQHRWPEKKIYRKEIEAKPWYMRSFEEVVELYCGDEIRAEKYPTFNKSFVSKASPSPSSSKASSSPQLRADRPAKHPNSRRSPAAIRTPTKSPSAALATASSPITPMTDEEIVREVKTRHLRLKDMHMMLEEIDGEIAELEAHAKHDHDVVQRVIQQTNKSDRDLQRLRAYAASILRNAHSVVNKLIASKQVHQKHFVRFEEESREFNQKHYERIRMLPLNKLSMLIAEEERRQRLKLRIRRILVTFMRLMRAQGLLYRNKKLPSVFSVFAGDAPHEPQDVSPRRPVMYKKRVLADSTRRSVYEWTT